MRTLWLIEMFILGGIAGIGFTLTIMERRKKARYLMALHTFNAVHPTIEEEMRKDGWAL